MALLTQRWANNYPTWARARVDPSSMAQRFFSCFSETYDSLLAEKALLSESFKLYSEKKGLGDFYWVYLEEEDFFRKTGDLLYTYPTLVGTLSSGSTVSIERVDDSALLFNGVPTRLTKLSDETVIPLIWTSTAPDVYNEIKTPSRIGITVSGSTHYKIAGRDKGFAGYYLITVTGYDENHNRIEDTVHIRDDGTFKTHRIYSEITSVITDGFDGVATVFVEESYPVYLPDKFHSGVTVEREGPLHLRLFVDPTSTYTGLELYTKTFRQGTTYRRDKLPDFETDDLEEVIDQQIVLDPDGLKYSIKDFTISPLDGRVWTLSTTGDVYIHENTIREFLLPAEEQSEVTAMDIVPELYRIGLNDTLYLWTWFRQMRGPVKEVSIRRVSPSDVTTYLQSDRVTWGATIHKFEGELENATLPEDTWSNIRFSSLFDELGEWHFYCDSVILAGAGVGTILTSHTGIYCGYNKALKKYSLGLSGAEKIWFSKENHLAIVSNILSNSGAYSYYEVANDVFITDIKGQRILLREIYDEVEVTYG